MPFSRLLIANRGEIAVRVIRACREMGIEAVAVYSDADAGAAHVQLADRSVLIGPAPAGESYLRGERIIEAALRTGAQAVHPGYGFLSENASFARAVQEAGLVFIGPPPGAIESMGDKARARALMEKSGVPVVPGWQGPDDPDALAGAAEAVGYPVLVKAAAGGGGKGMRIANDPKELPDAIGAARREAAHAFADERLILEKYLPEARHIEIQIAAGSRGRAVHLNERECSVQRRHQKIIEESPSPLVDADLRGRMGQAAAAAAEAVGYTNLGTVEFIVDPESRAFYFLEMNTRLQVEHPVTEATTGLDLVRMQIEIAAGADTLPAPPPQFGHAIECRLYAEDPAGGFLPSAGPLLKFVAPQGPGVRVDTGVRTADSVSTHYDPLLAKIIVHAPDRPAAIRRMQAALRETVVLGVRSNLEFLQSVLAHPTFQAGEATTRFVERSLADWRVDGHVPVEALVAAALSNTARPSGQEPAGETPWTRLSGFRTGLGSRREGARR